MTPPRAASARGAVIWQVPPFVAVLLAGTAVAAAVLVPVHLWRPAVVWPVLLVVAAVSWRLARLVPVRSVPARPAWACIGIAAGHGLWAVLTHAEHVVLRRDAGSYALYAQWLATRHGLPIGADLPAFGGAAALADPAFTLDSPAFYEVSSGTAAHVVPQFLVGAPAWYGLGWWVAGWRGVFVLPGLTSAVALLAFAGLLLRLVRPRWAVVGTALLAVSQPVLNAARSTYSEPPALLLLVVAAGLVVDAARRHRIGDPLAARLALLAGALAGLAGLVRVDALREVALLMPALALVTLREKGWAWRTALGALVGLAVSAAAALTLSRPYLRDIEDSLVPLVALSAFLALASVALVVIHGRLGAASTDPRGTVPSSSRAAARGRRLLPALLAVATGLGWVGLLTRPVWLTVVDDPDSPVSRMVDGFQRSQGLEVVAGRTYAEDSLIWVGWWLGPLVVASCVVGCVRLAALAGRWWVDEARPAPPPWLVPAVVGLGSTVLTLWRPGITPDHPWADRRMVTVVLPFVVAAAVVLPAHLPTRLPERLRDRRRVLTWATVAGVVGSLGWALSATLPVALLRTERGEPSAVARVCATLRPGDVVLAVDPRGFNEWVQVVRGVCGVPAAAVRVEGGDGRAAAADVARVAERSAAAGHRVVLLSAEAETDLAALGARGAEPTRVRAHTHEAQRLLERRPTGWVGLHHDVRLGEWTPSAG